MKAQRVRRMIADEDEEDTLALREEKRAAKKRNAMRRGALRRAD